MIPSVSPITPVAAVAPMPGAVGNAALFSALFGVGEAADEAPATAVADDAPASERQDDADGGSMLPDAVTDPAWVALILGGVPATGGAAVMPANIPSPPPPIFPNVALTGREVALPPDTDLIDPAVSTSTPTAPGAPTPAATDALAAVPDGANVPDRRGGDETPPRPIPTPAQFVPAASPALAPFVATVPTAAATVPARPFAFRGAPAPARSPVAPTVPFAATGVLSELGSQASAAIPVTGDVGISMPPPIERAANFAPAPNDAPLPTAVAVVPGRIPPPPGAEPRQPLAAMALPPAPPGAPMLATGAVAPAGELFATAIHAAARRQPDDLRADPLSPAPVAPGGTAPIAMTASAGGSADPSLDMRHGNWPGAMIDHIEKLRDAADAVDTRIRLVPDALGGIDVSLRRHDDGVQVTLRADQAATQAILAEARPQLTAIAEARGIRLADAGVPGGAGGAGGDPSTAQGRQQPSFMPSAPASALPTTDPSDPADGRVA